MVLDFLGGCAACYQFLDDGGGEERNGPVYEKNDPAFSDDR